MIMHYRLEVGDVVETKKQHPCGSKLFKITRTGMDFKMLCEKCNKEIWITRPNLEKRITRVFRGGREVEVERY